MLDVVAINPFTSTCAPAPNKTPLGFRMMIFPLASKCPKIWLGLPLLIRFRTIDEDDGWINCVVSFEAMLKLCQSITALLLVSVTVTVLPAEPMLADPADTVPPMGFAKAAVVVSAVDDSRTAANNTAPLTSEFLL